MLAIKVNELAVSCWDISVWGGELSLHPPYTHRLRALCTCWS